MKYLRNFDYLIFDYNYPNCLSNENMFYIHLKKKVYLRNSTPTQISLYTL